MSFTTEVTMDDEQAIQVGNEIAELFHLKRRPDGYFETTWGSKTAMGIGYSIHRIMEKYK